MMLDEEHLLQPRTHPRQHLQLPRLVEEVCCAGDELSDVKDWILHLLQVVNPAQHITQIVSSHQVSQTPQTHHNPRLPLITDVGAADVESGDTLALTDQSHRLVLEKVAVLNIKCLQLCGAGGDERF